MRYVPERPYHRFTSNIERFVSIQELEQAGLSIDTQRSESTPGFRFLVSKRTQVRTILGPIITASKQAD